MSNFIHLHQHTHYSLLDGLTMPEEAIKIAKENEQSAIAITDHGTCGGFLQFQQAGKKYGVKPIFGCEMYFTEDILQDKEDRRAERFHMILLAKNEEGLQSLYRLQKSSWSYGFYYKPRIDWNMLDGGVPGLLATSSCMGGIVARCILSGEEDRAERIIDRMNDMFEDFYVELQPWNSPELNQSLIKIAEAKDIPLIGTIDCHYPTQAHKDVEEVLLCVNQWPSLKASQIQRVKDEWQFTRNKHSVIDKLDHLYPERFLRFYDHDHWVMSDDEVRSAFQQAGLEREDIFSNTLEIADKCSASISTGQSLLPRYSKKFDSYEYLDDLARFKMQEIGLKGDEYVDRLDEELAVIKRLDFSDYFLIIWDLVNWAKKNNILVGAGRGSAAGSLLSYVLGITDVDPITHNLIFWRFINPDRIDYPDIDLDFEDRKRDEVKQYLKERWGKENVAGIATYGEFKPKASVRDVARAFGCPVQDAMQVTQHFNDLDDFLNSPQTLEFRRNWPDVVEMCQKIYGRIRQSGAGAAGMVVSNKPLVEVAPIESRNDPHSDDRIEVIAYDLDDCQKLGLIKLDVLGLNTLSVVHDCYDIILERHGIDVREASQTLDDPRVFEEFSNANTVGIFQTESTAYKNLLLRMGIDNFYDLAASNALVRPGAMMSQTDTYIMRKKGEMRIQYDHPILEPITKETYGTFVYQEQIMETVVKLAGLSWGDADHLRKIMGKKLDRKEWEQWRLKFLDGAVKHISPTKAKKMWDDFVKFSGYAFNKSHAISYSKLSYQTMWLKINYPTEFMWALLKNEGDKEAISTYLLESIRLGIEILPPDVNLSDEGFRLEGNSIRFGLKNVANVGPAAVKNIISRRPFKSFEEFLETRDKRAVKASAIEALEKVNGFQSLNHVAPYEHKKYYFEILNFPVDLNRGTIFDDKLIPCASIVEDEKKFGVIKAIVRSTKRTPTYFRVEYEDGNGSFTAFAPKSMEIKPGEFHVALVGDKTIHDYISVYDLEENTEHPLYKFLTSDVLGEYKECYDYEVGKMGSAKVLCHIVSVKKYKTKAGQMMASAYVWDGDDYYKITFFPASYGKYVFSLVPWTTVVLKPIALKQNKFNPNGGWTIQDSGLIKASDFLALKR